MEFPTEAVFGGNLSPTAILTWDGRDDSITPRRDDDDEAGNVEVVIPIHGADAPGAIMKRLHINDDEPVSPHMDANIGLNSAASKQQDDSHRPHHHHHEQQQQQLALVNLHLPSSPTSPSSIHTSNSLLNNLSDLENSLNDETSTLKEYMIKVKSERNQLRHDKNLLTKQLAFHRKLIDAEGKRHENEVSRLKVELSLMKSQWDGDRSAWMEEKRLWNENALQVHSSAMEELRETVARQKTKIASLEEALMKEKCANALHEADKLEEIQKQHSVQLKQMLSELNTKFDMDLKEMSKQKEAEIMEEQACHAKTREELALIKSILHQVEEKCTSQIEELVTLKVDHEKYTMVMKDLEEFEKVKGALTSVTTELELSKANHAKALNEVQTLTNEKLELATQLQTTTAGLNSLEEMFEEEQLQHKQEIDRMAEESKKALDAIVTEASSEQEKAMNIIKEAQDQVQHLQKTIVEQQGMLTQLTEEVANGRTTIDSLLEGKRAFELNEEESKIEIKRLQKRLEETAGDILRCVESNDNSQASGGGDDCKIPAEDSTTSSSSSSCKDAAAMLALPSLGGENEAGDITPEHERVAEETMATTTTKSCEERDTSRCDVIERTQRERDAVHKMIDTLSVGKVESLEKEIMTLRDKLSKAEEVYIKAEVEKSELLSTVQEERDELRIQLEMLKTSLQTSNVGDEDFQPTNAKEEVQNLQFKLDVQVRVNQLLSTELALLHGEKSTKADPTLDGQTTDITSDITAADSAAKSTDTIKQLQEQLDSQMQRNEMLSSELAKLKDVATGDVAIQVGKGFDEVMHEHQIEIKLLKKELAETKTVAKLLTKEKDSLADAFAVEQKSNDELEKSLEEVVNLLTAERGLHEKNAKENKILKKSVKKMKKKFIPLDAAYKACQQALDRMERNQASGQVEVANTISTIDHLMEVLEELEGPAGTDQSSELISKTSMVDNNRMDEFRIKCKRLQDKVKAISLTMVSRGTENKLATLPAKDESAQAILDNLQSTEMERLHSTNQGQEERINQLKKELQGSNKALKETVAYYETVFTQVKDKLSAKNKEIEALKCELEKARISLSAQEDGDESTLLSAKDVEINSYREVVDVLKRKLDEKEVIIAARESEKTKLREEVLRLKADFTEVISQFEIELTKSCEASNAALQQKSVDLDSVKIALLAKEEECKELVLKLQESYADSKKALQKTQSELEVAKASLLAKQEECNELSTAGKAVQEMSELIVNYEFTIHSLRDELSQKCEASNAALRKTQSELEAAKASLLAKQEDELSTADKAVQEMSELIVNHEFTIHSLRDELSQKELERQELENESKLCHAEVQRLQSMLDSAQMNLNENVQKNEQIQSDCASLKEERDSALHKIRELTGQIDHLTVEKSSLIEKLEMRIASNKDLNASIDSLHEENKSLLIKLEQQSKSCESMAKNLSKLQEEAMLSEEGRLKATQSAQAAEDARRNCMKEIEKAKEDMCKKDNNIDILREEKTLAQTALQSLQDELLQAIKSLDDVKEALASEKENTHILLSQLKVCEDEIKSHAEQKRELEVELASRLESESAMADKLTVMVGLEKELASRMESENAKDEQIGNLESRIQAMEKELATVHTQMLESENDHNAELSTIHARTLECENAHNAEIAQLKAKILDDHKEQMRSMEIRTKSLKLELKEALKMKMEEASNLRVLLQEARDKLVRMQDDNNANLESYHSLRRMFDDAVRDRTSAEESLQENIQLLEKLKRMDIKRSGEVSKLEQTNEVLECKVRYLESYVASLKEQLR